MTAAPTSTEEIALTYTVEGDPVEFKYGQPFHAPGARYGVVMIPTGVGPKFVAAYRRSIHSPRWRRLRKQHNDPTRALAEARSKYGTPTNSKDKRT